VSDEPFAPVGSDVMADDDGPAIHPVASSDVEAALASMVAKLPGGQLRPAQVAMANAVADGITRGVPTIVEAPTGTGKSLAYLVPLALAAGSEPAIVATATLTLQQQLIDTDLPALVEQFPGLTYAILKGRSNFLCLDKVADLDRGQATFSFKADEGQQAELAEWAATTDTGDGAELPDGIEQRLFRELTVGPRECTGRKCSFFDDCFAEQAKAKAFGSNIVVTNVHMLLLDAQIDADVRGESEDDPDDPRERTAGGFVLPRHRVVVIDEAHKLPEIASRVLGVELAPGRLNAAATTVAPFVEGAIVDRLRDDATLLGDRFDEMAKVDDGRLASGDESWAWVLREVAKHVGDARRQVDAAEVDGDREVARRQRALLSLGSLIEDLSALAEATKGTVVWVEPGGNQRRPSMTSAPIDVAPMLRNLLFDNRTVIATSATLAVSGTFDHVARQFGLNEHPPRPALTLKVDSPFDHKHNSLLYVPKEWPDPRSPKWQELYRERTLRFVRAAGGRTMLLFTSHKHLRETVDWIAPHLKKDGITLHVQGEAPTGRLIERMRQDETSVLAGTTSFWEGVDVPGDALSLVVIDKLPFPRRGDPLRDARREAVEAAGGNGFQQVDIPHTATLLAQGAGRLLRRVDDVGVVAVMDSRLATKSYRRAILETIPPFTRTIDPDAVVRFLGERLRRD
jgi:ATP-dependent DNA helicase DinG